MNFFEDMGIIFGYLWGKHRKESYLTVRSKHDRIDDKMEKTYQQIKDLYLKIDEKSGKTYAKIFYEKNRPEWYWLKSHVPKRIVDEIKKESDIVD